eukprot:CAMPEP_0118925604 /NCGR_PEP_ID=MMETSP1169-20130426/3468_1 /TAXON_ID=36882 /ORGANISM="Pyramimonas obovata, Strain CCMP722" /LENGTH=130 /DNA_ID=CAMNT_0006866951 /DNA_START=195 /DNA_END=587 /DNA_ORIENTATION=+
MDKLKQGLAEVERVAEDLLAAKEQVVEIDLARNKNREASTALRKLPQSSGGSFGNAEKGYLLRPGGFFLRVSPDKAQNIINEDQERLEREITETRDKMKKLTRSLEDKGGVPESCGPGLLNAMLTLRDKA